ncbi:hypothetical protein [Rhodoferax saidenbachensis]|uniref:Uncharacterized protein n=1 Tax=Rhodoferax saidenbachensis TaxID=1484693 RepID=A0A1P8KC11_9BURK|nr:hypothetical protein [Rhodoferax saidenbachensis]APW43543.1 hypothetical protein RS694_14040 [Rhodoferax saidenbachensis]
MQTAPIPIEQLAAEVYDSAPPPVQDRMVSLLVGKIYESAPVAERSNLVTSLMKPLGVLSLVAVANGIFANIRFRNDWPDVQVRPDDVQNIRAQDVVDLANYAQQVSTQVLDGLARIVTGSPVLATSAAAALLIHMLVQRQQTRRST